jgi:hypothetical protein
VSLESGDRLWFAGLPDNIDCLNGVKVGVYISDFHRNRHMLQAFIHRQQNLGEDGGGEEVEEVGKALHYRQVIFGNR